MKDFNQPQSIKKRLLKAMNLIKNDQWSDAHDIVENLNDPLSAHVHAYLHRIEGDNWNADYWYRKAGASRPDLTIEKEWDQLNALINGQ